MTPSEQGPDLTEKIVFGLGDIFIGGSQVIIAFYYLRFLTDVVQISPAIAGTIVLISKVWDAISDPLMGVITDNTRTRWGRRRPWFIVGFFGILSSFVLLWYPVGFEGESAKFLYVLATYMYFSTVATVVLVPYASMSSEITTDYRERNNVNGIRLFFSQCSSLLAAVLPLNIIALYDDPRMGWLAMGTFFAVFYATPYLVIFFKTRERVPLTAAKSSFSLATFIGPFKVKTFRSLVMMYFMAYLAMDVVAAVFQYYMYYYLERKDETDLVIGTMLIAQIVLIPAVVTLANRYGKATVYKFSILLWLAGAILMAFFRPDWPGWGIYAIAALVGSGVVGCVVMPWSMFPDVTDVGELQFGHRVAGSFSGVMTFMRKLSGAIGIFAVGLVLQFSGYRPPLQQQVNGAYTEVLQTQPDNVVLALKLIVLVFPLLLLLPSFLIAGRYPLDRATHARLYQHLMYRRGEVAEDNLSPGELEQLKRQLIG